MVTLLLLTVLALPPQTQTLILRTGTHIAVDGPITEKDGRIVFRSKGGQLYSLPIDEVDAEATKALALQPPPAPDDGKKKLKVSAAERERLLKELATNHSGTPGAIPQPPAAPPAPSKEETAEQTREEWQWRREARAYDEAVTRAKENLALLEQRAAKLQDEIRSLVILGYKPKQFSYQTTELQTCTDQIPYARLEVKRAERAREEFREDARRQGILPGWLR